MTSSPTAPSNTLTFTNLENHHFDQPFLLKLRAQTETFGQVCFFSPIKTFHRVFVVYHSVFDAQRAKSLLHNTRFQDATLRVYFGQHTELSIDPEKYYLHLPDHLPTATTTTTCAADNNASSPPGSPPVGHVDDEDMESIDDFSLETGLPSSLTSSQESLALQTTPTTIYLAPAPYDSNESSKLPPSLHKLRIDTLRTSLASSLSPRSPITPTRLAFSPAVGSQGEQPFITIQDWGVEATPCF
ncbi:hypothetical protein BGX26_011075 [Mortierella sp. AD094]|nr:hypothetical protein BGX26_011075 [Mortierella sp. AD094]